MTFSSHSGTSDRAKRGNRRVQMLMEEKCDRVALERKPARQKLVSDHAKRIQIRSRIKDMRIESFRRHILRSTDGAAVLREVGELGHPGNSEVEDFQMPALGDHHVLWFQVAMDDLFSVAGG